jgi:ubiquinone/menaquinone biosynthesis C-methylase UbiE
MSTQSEQTDVFDEIAPNYRQIHNQTIGFSGADSDHFSEQKVAHVRRVESGSPDILDLGCGDGNSAVFFGKYFPNSRYFGIDSSAKSVVVARAKEVSGAKFACYDGERIPYGENLFDLVFIACVLHHIPRERHTSVLREVRRVLKPGGRVYVFEHNPLNPVTRKVVRDCPFDEGVVLLNVKYTKERLVDAGFRDEKIAFTIFFPRHSIFRPFLGLERYLAWLPLGGQYVYSAVKA